MTNLPLDTRTRIMDVAQDLIQRRGVNAMSFQDIANAVGVRKPSLYHHFAKKEALVEALLDRYRSEFRASVDGALSGAGTGRIKLRRYFGLFSGTLESGNHDKVCLCGVLAAEKSSLGEAANDGLRTFFHENLGILADLIAQGISDQSLRSNLKPRAQAELVLAALEGALLLARTDEGPRQMKRIASNIITSLST